MEEEKLKNRVYEIMIELAEKELNVPVRKKYFLQIGINEDACQIT